MCVPLRCTPALPAGLLVLALLVVGGDRAHAHGVLLEQNTRSDLDVVEITAVFDNGEPMAGALITVFNPRHPTHPWLTGRANGEGRFWFVPDAGQPGYWTVRVREDDHGAMISVEVPDARH
jgi:nickel transport protein